MDISHYVQQFVGWSLTSEIRIGITLILAIVAIRIGKALSARLIAVLTKQKDDTEFQKRTQTLGSMVRYVLNTAVLIVAVMIVLGE